MIDDDGELAPMDDRILAAYRREFGPRRRARRNALLAVPIVIALGAASWAVMALRERPVEKAKAQAPAAAPTVPAHAARRDAPLVTQTSLAGFEPVDDMEVNVVGGGGTP